MRALTSLQRSNWRILKPRPNGLSYFKGLLEWRLFSKNVNNLAQQVCFNDSGILNLGNYFASFFSSDSEGFHFIFYFLYLPYVLLIFLMLVLLSTTQLEVHLLLGIYQGEYPFGQETCVRNEISGLMLNSGVQ